MVGSETGRRLAVWVGAALTASLLVAAGPLAADEEGYGRLFALVKVADNALVDVPVMGSAIREDGRVVDQNEKLLVRAPNVVSLALDDLPAGLYDVRVEGDGLVTEVKRGVWVFAGRDSELNFVLRPGSGVHVVEYAVGGLSREEVAARLSKLEGETSRLDGELRALRSSAGGG